MRCTVKCLTNHSVRAYVTAMPAPDEISITMKRKLASEWRTTAEYLGYGKNGRHALLRLFLRYAKEFPIFFEKR